jgi:predicted nucleic acid-binding protein
LDYENKRLIARDFFKENPVVSSQVISEYLNVMKRNFNMQKLELMQSCSLVAGKMFCSACHFIHNKNDSRFNLLGFNSPPLGAVKN